MFYLFPFILSLILSLILTPIIRFLALKKNWGILKVRPRDSHQKPTPRLGGLVIFVSFWSLVFGLWFLSPEKLLFTPEKIMGLDQNLIGVFLASTIWLVVGVIDDIRGIKPFWKFFWQGICGLIIIAFGIQIWWFSNPAGGLNIIVGNWNWLLVPIWIGLLMNVINWFDGLDGLAGGISFISLAILFFLSMEPNVNQPATALVCAILAGSTLGFLFFNWHPAKIFLGDSGSMLLGLLIGAFSIMSGAKLATAALVLGIPVIDAFWVILQRLAKKKPIWSADKIHLFHKLSESGLSVKQIVITLYTLSAAFGIVALQSDTLGKLKAGLYLVGVMVLLIIGVYIKSKQTQIHTNKKTN